MSNLNTITEPIDTDLVLKNLFKVVYNNGNNENQTPDDFAKVNHIGNNRRKIFIGVMRDEKDVLNANERSFLQKILGAVKLSEEDVFIAPLNNIQRGSFNRFLSHFGFEKLIFFGIEPKQLGWHIEVKPYERTWFVEKEILFAELLSVLSVNESSKKKLWGQLQLIFPIK